MTILISALTMLASQSMAQQQRTPYMLSGLEMFSVVTNRDVVDFFGGNRISSVVWNATDATYTVRANLCWLRAKAKMNQDLTVDVSIVNAACDPRD